jgi:hypothetical protein
MAQRAGFSANKIGRGYSHLLFLEYLSLRLAGDGRCPAITSDSTTVNKGKTNANSAACGMRPLSP